MKVILEDFRFNGQLIRHCEVELYDEDELDEAFGFREHDLGYRGIADNSSTKSEHFDEAIIGCITDCIELLEGLSR